MLSRPILFLSDRNPLSDTAHHAWSHACCFGFSITLHRLGIMETQSVQQNQKVLSPILYRPTHGSLAFFCPGCECLHVVPLRSFDAHVEETGQVRNNKPVAVIAENKHKASWVWNGNVNAPTFLPSLHIKIGHYVPGQPQPPLCETCNDAKADQEETLCSVCHLFVDGGLIKFLDDCTHHLAGQTVKIPPLPDYIVKGQTS